MTRQIPEKLIHHPANAPTLGTVSNFSALLRNNYVSGAHGAFKTFYCITGLVLTVTLFKGRESHSKHKREPHDIIRCISATTGVLLNSEIKQNKIYGTIL